MSWLNLNDSLNNLKGQISNFANNVLADEDQHRGATSSSTEFEELQRLCNKQQEEINYLHKLNAELRQGKSTVVLSQNHANLSKEAWSWEISDAPKNEKPNTDEIIANLKKTIHELENEKHELVSNLELLDNEHQVNTEKLITMKDQLQESFNELEDKYNVLQAKNKALIENKKELDDLKLKYEAVLSKSSLEKEHKDTVCVKCEKLLKENQKYVSEIETLTNQVVALKSNNSTLQKILEDSKKASDDDFSKLEQKLKLCESENKILVAELQKATKLIAEYENKIEIDAQNCKKLALILEGYEQQVSALKEKLLLAQNSTTSSSDTERIEDLKNSFEKVQNELEKTIIAKEQTHTKYVNILTEYMRKYAYSGKPTNEISNPPNNEDDPQVTEFSHQVESILNILLDLKCKCESLEKELCNATQEKTKILSEKNHEIEKLLHNSEILSQEVITKSQTIKDYENECNELIKNNDMLINELEVLKNNSGLQTISESNEDNLLLLESQLENANKKIEELERIIVQLENSSIKEKSSEDEELISKSLHQRLVEEFNQLKESNLSLRKEFESLEKSYQQVTEEKDTLNLMFEKVKTDFENTEYQYTETNLNMETLKEEVETYKKKIEELLEQKLCLEKLNMDYERNNEDIRSELNVVREKLLLEEDAKKQLESQIRNMTEKLQNAKMCETSLKLQYDTISKELIALTDAKCMVETSLESALSSYTQCQNNLVKVREEKESLKTTITDLEAKLEAEKKNNAFLCEENKKGSDFTEEKSCQTNDQLQNDTLLEEKFSMEKLQEENFSLNANLEKLQDMYDSLLKEKDNLEIETEKLRTVTKEHLNCHQSMIGLEKKIEELSATKHELTNVIITKHQENVTYHNEIQRLSQILNAEVEKSRSLEIQLQTAKTSIVDTAELANKNEEIEKLTDQNAFLRQKCEVLAENLLQEQNQVQQLLAEQNTPSEREQALSKKLERLQAHLIEIEEHYTQELLRAEERNTEFQSKLNEIEQREKNSSTMYTSVSIRANQHVETLQHQLQLITNQRDELRKRISDAEDYSKKQEAALANLQFVLEQFQKEKENDVQKETERIRRQITAEREIQQNLKKEISGLQSQLEESKHGLFAASRLSDQLEQSKHLVTSLRTEVSQLKEKLNKTEEKLQNLSRQTDGKVDKSLIKNLVIGFVTTNNNLSKDQVQILKIIATVLDFNQQDHDKINLNKPQQGWLSSFLSPQASQGMSQESLSQAFVKFLENESKPRQVPSLLSNHDETPKSRKNSVTVPRQSPSVLSEVILPTFADFAQNRNSSSILKDVLKDSS